MAKNHAYTYDRDDHGAYHPHGPVRWRPTCLRREAVELYEAQSFLIWRYNEFFNTHITITPGLMGIVDHKRFASLMPAFNKELKRWLALGNEDPRRKWRKWLRTKSPQEHHWIYVLENASGNGIHAHELCVVPKRHLRAFETVVRVWWSKVVGFAIPAEAIDIRQEKSSHARHVQWFRYLIKSVDRELPVIDANGLPRTLGEILKPEPYWETEQTYAPRLAGICRSLGPMARATPLVVGCQPVYFWSKFDKRDLDDVYDGWEIEAVRDRPMQALMSNMSSSFDARQQRWY